MLYRNKACIGNRIAADEYQPQRPVEFQAKCMVVLIEAESRKALLDELVASGRILDQPLKISMNFTTALSVAPNLPVTSMSCAIGDIVLENYHRDAVGQEVQLQLKSLKDRLEQAETRVELFDKTLRGLSAYRPPNSPPPPSPPPLPAMPPGLLAPPTPPRAVPFDTRLEQLRRERSALQKAVSEKQAEIGGPCVKSATNTCGRTFAAAPNPWLAADGTRCAGYATAEALEGSFCAHWGSPVRCCLNPCAPHARSLSQSRDAEQRRGCRERRGRGAAERRAAVVLERDGRHCGVLANRRPCHPLGDL